MAAAAATSMATATAGGSIRLDGQDGGGGAGATSSLPVPNPTTSYWQAEAAASPLHDHGQHDALPREAEPVDVAIVGSGISGAMAAHMLMQREGETCAASASASLSGHPRRRPPTVAMLEARRACSGATGRNGGHCRPDSFAGFEKYSRIVGEAQAHKVLQNEWDTFLLIESLCSRSKAEATLGKGDEEATIDCDWWRGQTLSVYRSPEIRDSAKHAFERYKEYNGGSLRQGVRFIDDEGEARKLSRVPDAVGAAVWPAGSLHPLRFVHGLLERCLAHPEFHLYTHTPAESVSRSSDDELWKVITPRGTLTARTVLFATNGYSTRLLPSLQPFLTPHRAQCSSIAPPAHFLGPLALATTASIVKGVGDYEYLTQRPSRGGANTPHQADREGDGILILGGGHPHASRTEQIGTYDDTVVIDTITEHLRKFPSETFDGWQTGQGDLTHIWTGIQGYTRDSLPIVGAAASEGVGRRDSDGDGMFLSLGHHGHGMARAATCARGVARLLLRALDGKAAEDAEHSTQEAAESDEAWEMVTSLPSCYRWTDARAQRRDVDCLGDL